MWIKLLPYLSAAVLLASVYTVGHIKGNSSCVIEREKIAAAMVAKEEQNHVKIEQKVNSLSDERLNRALSKFMRD